MFIILAILIAINSNHLSYAYQACTSSDSVADSKILTTLNGKLQGVCYDVTIRDHHQNVTNSDVFGWMSIPYAEAPVGENRFMNPKPVKSWNDVLDATKKPVACMQRTFNPNQKVAEDCLYLNIYVRADTYLNREDSNNLKPILFWIHGGGYVQGSGSGTDAYTLVALKDVVVVSINYRLGPFGFFNLEDTDATGNQGFLDQHLALKWVYDNADKFGGDRNRITISGTSAGAAFVNFHLFYKPSWPLFRSGILESSGVEGPNSVNLLMTSRESTNNAEQLMHEIGCRDFFNDDKLECGQKVNATEIINKLSRNLPFNRLTFDNKVWTKKIDQLSAEKDFKKCNVITGFNADEIHFPNHLPFNPQFFSNLIYQRLNGIVHADLPENHVSLILNEYFNTTDVSTIEDFNYPLAATRILSDAMFVCANFKTAETYNSNIQGQKSWVYEFKYKNTKSDLPDYYYAAHGSEVRYVFGQPLSFKWPTQPFDLEDAVFDQKMLNYWGNFLHNDDVNTGNNPQWSSRWREFNTVKNEFIEFGNFAIKMKSGYESHHCNFWNNIIQ